MTELYTARFGFYDPILERPTLAHIAEQIATNARVDETAFQWEQVDELAPQFKLHLRPLLLTVEFAAARAHDPLLEAIAFLKGALQQGKGLSQTLAHAFPTRFIPVKLKRYLYAPALRGRKRLLLDRYEFLLYRLLRQGFGSGGSLLSRQCALPQFRG